MESAKNAKIRDDADLPIWQGIAQYYLASVRLEPSTSPDDNALSTENETPLMRREKPWGMAIVR